MKKRRLIIREGEVTLKDTLADLNTSYVCFYLVPVSCFMVQGAILHGDGQVRMHQSSNGTHRFKPQSFT